MPVRVHHPSYLDITALDWERDQVPPASTRKSVLRLTGLCLLAGVLLAGVLLPVAGAAGTLSNQASDAVGDTVAEVLGTAPPVPTVLVDTAGVPLARLYEQYRVPAPVERIADTMKAAIVAIEDQRFYDHEGVDLFAIGRALLTNMVRGEIAQGGSTLTQQYVKNHLKHVTAATKQERDRATEQSGARKLRELRTAVQVERSLSKDEILGRYLNLVPFGHNSYGVGAAARAYFDIPQERLSVAQAALLAGIVNEPSGLNPYRFPERALARRNVVIEEMARQDRIPAAVAEREKRAPLGLVPEMARPPNGCVGVGEAGYFCDYVLHHLAAAGLSREQLRRGGYTIKTTLDRDALTKAKAAVDTQVPPETDHVANAMAIVKPGKDKHRVLALTANRTHGLNQDKHETTLGLPYAPQNLGAGSIYKIFTAAAALENGMSVTDTVQVPSTYTSSVFLGGGASCPLGAAGLRKYCVHNNEGSDYAERMTLQEALASSPNTTFVQLLEHVGVPAAVDVAVRLGLRSLATTVAAEDGRKRPIGRYFAEQNLGSFTLGPTPTSTLELANVGATLASSGTWCPPSPVEEVLDRDGRRVPLREQPCTQAVKPEVADALTAGLSKDAVSGTAATAAKAYGWDRPMAGKTGTTQEHKSAGFLGYTPQLAAAVFTFDDSSAPATLCDPGGSAPPRPCTGGRYIYGGKFPARTWFHAMNGLGHSPGIMSAMERADLPTPPTERREPFEEPDAVAAVVGLDVEEARTRLENAGHRVRTVMRASTKRKGTVLAQSAGESTAVTLTVSAGAAAPTTASTSKPTRAPVVSAAPRPPRRTAWPTRGG